MAADLAVSPIDSPDVHEEHRHARIPMRLRIVNLIAVILPLAGLIVAAMLLWGWGFSWVHLSVMLGMYLATVLGVTVGYHRHFTHRSFETNPVMKAILGIF